MLSQVVLSGGKTREAVTAILAGYLDVGAALQSEIDRLLDCGLIAPGEDGLLLPTAEGAALQAEAAEHQLRMRARIHDGIPDEEYVRVLKVFQRMIHNVGGEAWHH